jgi:hypothetical protein
MRGSERGKGRKRMNEGRERKGRGGNAGREKKGREGGRGKRG